MSLPPNIHTSRLQRHSCQVHSSYIPESQTDTPSPFKIAAGTLPQGSKFLASSLGRSNKISHYLVPLISKFEALDALSHGLEILSLQPAHLKLPRKQSEPPNPLGEVDDPTHKSYKNTSISPQSRGRSRCEDVLPEKSLGLVPPDDAFTSTTNNVQILFKRSGSRRLKQAQLPHKVSSIRLRGVVQQHDFGTLKQSDFGSKIRGRHKHPEEIAGYSAGKSVVMERIKNFDGSTDPRNPSLRLTLTHVVASDSAHRSPVAARSVATNITLRPSPKYAATSTIPSPRRLTDPRDNVDLYSVSSKMAEWKPTTISTKHDHPYMHTNYSSIFQTKRTNPVFGQNAPNPFSQTSVSKSSISSVSPKTKRSPRLAISKRDNHLLVGCPLYGASKEVPDPIKTGPSQGEPRGRPFVSSRIRGNPMSLERRRTSQKIDALYRAKSLERDRYQSPETSRAREVVISVNTRLKRHVFPPVTTGKIEHTREWWEQSKVEDMKMFYERAVGGKKFSSLPSSLYKASNSRISRLSKLEEWSNPPPSPPPLPVFPSSAAKTAAGSPVLRPKRLKVEGSRIPTLVMQDQPVPATPTAKKRDTKSIDIRDKIKIFESKEKGKEVQRNDSAERGSKGRGKEAQRVNTLLKKSSQATIKERANLFENPRNDGRAKRDDKRGPIGQEVQDIIDEFQDMAMNTELNVEKTSTTTGGGGWNVVIGPRLRSLAEQKDGEVDDGFAEAEQEMIIKQAQCELTEPKPLRASELKRMLLLCKGKIQIAGAVHRNKGAGAPSSRV